MSLKLIVMVRRQVGLTSEEFRDGYEGSHSRIAVELFGHLWTAYRRNYLTRGDSFAGASETAAADAIGFDAVSEFVMRDAAALDEMSRITANHLARIKEDEARWFDQKHSWLVACETIEEDLSAWNSTGRPHARTDYRSDLDNRSFTGQSSAHNTKSNPTIFQNIDNV